MAKKYLDEEDDVYSGFLQPSMDTLFYDLEPTGNTNEHITFSTPRLNNQSALPKTSNFYSRGNLTTGLKSSNSRGGGGGNERQLLARPSTAVRAVGYTSEAGKLFDPIFQHSKNSKQRTNIIEKLDQEPQEKYKSLELKIKNLLEDSILCGIKKYTKFNINIALNKAKEASSLDRTLLRLRDQNGGTSLHNFDLTYSVFFNLARQYTKNEMYIEALNTYTIMTKNKMFPNVNRLKLNMGNIYYQMGIYNKAIKMYRMALDQVTQQHKSLRLKITYNIGIILIKMEQYSDAAINFEYIISEESSNIQTVLNLILCYYLIGDTNKLKLTFKLLCDVNLNHNNNYDIDLQLCNINDNHDDDININQYIYDAIKIDELQQYYHKNKKYAEKSIIMIVNLISPIIDENFNDGYNWCIEIIKGSNFAWLSNELELNKALIYLRQNNYNQAIETLKFYEKKEPTMAATAVTNLTFIYINMNELLNAEQYAEKSRQIDNYNPAGFINSGVIEILKKDYHKAKYYLELALTIDITSFEANYNLCLVLKYLNDYENSELILNKIKLNMLQHIKHSDIYYQLANIQELYDQQLLQTTNKQHNQTNVVTNASNSLDLYIQLLGITNEMDSKLYEKIGNIYENFNDPQEANQYYNEAYRINPSNINIATSIGSYYIKLQAIERAIYYYERAVLANPNDPNLMLRAASCYRHMLTPKNYLNLFIKIFKQFPDNLLCLKALIHITKQNGMQDLYEKYTIEYNRIERKTQQHNQQQRKTSARIRSGGGRRSANSNKSPTKLDTSGGGGGGNKSLRQSSALSNDMNSLISNDSFGNLMRSYADPLGPPAERPRTGQIQRSLSKDSDDDINTEELLPM